MAACRSCCLTNVLAERVSVDCLRIVYFLVLQLVPAVRFEGLDFSLALGCCNVVINGLERVEVSATRLRSLCSLLKEFHPKSQRKTKKSYLLRFSLIVHHQTQKPKVRRSCSL